MPAQSICYIFLVLLWHLLFGQLLAIPIDISQMDFEWVEIGLSYYIVMLLQFNRMGPWRDLDSGCPSSFLRTSLLCSPGSLLPSNFSKCICGSEVIGIQAPVQCRAGFKLDKSRRCRKVSWVAHPERLLNSCWQWMNYFKNDIYIQTKSSFSLWI